MHIDWSAMGGWASFAATIAVGFVIYGRLTQKVEDNTEDIKDLRHDVNRHDRSITRIKTHLGLQDHHDE